ncbi:hypothetical protein LTR37_013854 [Vermiconidia calcicola]|uniref:Uncharacterized protein n=1 Tax=Vermiconidia calcicola TaxID=1690605 RepID=A0ACC3MVJ2_9PEZI|nr:hypothetical protein LTR37_013854 [Vermiconidia calcicola]
MSVKEWGKLIPSERIVYISWLAGDGVVLFSAPNQRASQSLSFLEKYASQLRNRSEDGSLSREIGNLPKRNNSAPERNNILHPDDKGLSYDESSTKAANVPLFRTLKRKRRQAANDGDMAEKRRSSLPLLARLQHRPIEQHPIEHLLVQHHPAQHLPAKHHPAKHLRGEHRPDKRLARQTSATVATPPSDTISDNPYIDGASPINACSKKRAANARATVSSKEQKPEEDLAEVVAQGKGKTRKKGHDSANDKWCNANFETRGFIIRQRDQTTRVTVLVTADNKGGSTRQLPRKRPQEGVLGIDYPLVQRLCDTYVQECDRKWYRQEMKVEQMPETSTYSKQPTSRSAGTWASQHSTVVDTMN